MCLGTKIAAMWITSEPVNYQFIMPIVSNWWNTIVNPNVIRAVQNIKNHFVQWFHGFIKIKEQTTVVIQHIASALHTPERKEHFQSMLKS